MGRKQVAQLVIMTNEDNAMCATVLPHLKKVSRTGERLAIPFNQQVQIKRRQPAYSETNRCANDNFTVRDLGSLNY